MCCEQSGAYAPNGRAHFLAVAFIQASIRPGSHLSALIQALNLEVN